MSIKEFIKHHYRHFNAAVVVDAAEAYAKHLDAGGKMFLAMAGAMSTAELGLSLAEMIRNDKISAICTTGANLEEDIFNLVAHRSLQARAELPQPHRRRRTRAARKRPQSRDRHLHPRRRGYAPHRTPGAEVLAEGR